MTFDRINTTGLIGWLRTDEIHQHQTQRNTWWMVRCSLPLLTSDHVLLASALTSDRTPWLYSRQVWSTHVLLTLCLCSRLITCSLRLRSRLIALLIALLDCTHVKSNLLRSLIYSRSTHVTPRLSTHCASAHVWSRAPCVCAHVWSHSLTVLTSSLIYCDDRTPWLYSRHSLTVYTSSLIYSLLTVLCDHV
jgi:hypothetical protein